MAGALRWLLVFALVVMALIVALPDDAKAQSATCRALKAQLATIETGRGGGNSKQYQRYQRAIQDQTVQIRKTERASRRNNCALRSTNKCQRISASLGKMHANLRKLKRQAQRFAPKSGTRAQRAAVLRSMKRNGCGQQNTTRTANIRTEKPRRPTLLEQIFGSRTYTSEGVAIGEAKHAPIRRGGTYRTLCVRTCDGYYFPISFSTSKSRFEEDLAQCEAMCPGTETALFVHPQPGGDAETSISYRTGQPYNSLQNAFSYRKSVNSECSCRRSTMTGFEEVAGQGRVEKVEPNEETLEAVLPTPTFRQDIALDEETHANRAGKVTDETLVEIATGSGKTLTGKGNVRIVGPAFFPVQ